LRDSNSHNLLIDRSLTQVHLTVAPGPELPELQGTRAMPAGSMAHRISPTRQGKTKRLAQCLQEVSVRVIRRSSFRANNTRPFPQNLYRYQETGTAAIQMESSDKP
jgi:hypothetical protein